jgi:uncharacterized membrane protein
MSTRDFTRIAMIAAVYTALTLALAPFSFGKMQVRIAEALTILPLLYKPAIWGVTLGCFLANLIGAMNGFNALGLLDCVVGTAATLGAAWCTWRLRGVRIHGFPLLSVLMPAVWNFVFVGAELGFLCPIGGSILYGWLISGAWVALGETIAGLAGWVLTKALAKRNFFADEK